MVKIIRFSFLILFLPLFVNADAKPLSLDMALTSTGHFSGADSTSRFPSVGLRRKITFILEKGQRRVLTGITFIVPESDSVSLNGTRLVRGKDYRLNYLRGTLILANPAAGGEKLTFRYIRYPFHFSPLFTARVPGDSTVTYSTVVNVKRKKERSVHETPEYLLNLSGSKSVGISVGTGKGMGLDQSLQISMSGMIAKGIKVSAYLTDDNLPVQPEGNTEEIRQLDKVYVRVESENAHLTFGDLSTGVSWAKFSSFRRNLRGVSGSLIKDGWRVFAGAGINKGRYRTVRLVGREGVQGPYELLQSRRFNEVIVLPGSESVYLDGRLLKRGRENDYVINYALGTVTFTEKVMITGDSEIVVDFQISEDNYRRTSVFAGWMSPEYHGALRFRASYEYARSPP